MSDGLEKMLDGLRRGSDGLKKVLGGLAKASVFKKTLRGHKHCSHCIGGSESVKIFEVSGILEVGGGREWVRLSNKR